MLLRLVSSSPVPEVLFTLTFPNLPDYLPFPTNWIAQLQRLAEDDLEVPSITHVLDKSTWIISLLEEVTFDLTCLTVTCSFIDGTAEEWPLLQYECIYALERVVSDVNQSAIESSEADDKDAPSSIPRPPIPCTPGKRPKHKKSRSLLMSIVATLIPSISLSSPIKELFSRPSSPTLPPSAVSVAPATPLISALSLRRRARSCLVDTYRRFIATELSKRVRPGGYYAWNAESLLNKHQAQMNYLVEQAGGAPPEADYDSPLTSGITKCSFRPRPYGQSPYAYGDDDGDIQSIADTTDTDSSSVHTPTEIPMVPRLEFYHQADMPRTPSPPHFSTEDMELFTSLSQQCLRLRQILFRMEMYQMNLEGEERHLHSVLEVKSRRRAWSNRQFCGGAPIAYVGFSTPFRSSPLAIFEPATSEDWIQNDISDSFYSLSISTAEHDLSELFPRIEEHCEDAAQVDLESLLVGDLEMGLLNPTQYGLTQPPPRRIRRRSNRMSSPLDLDGDFSLEGILPRSPGLPSSPLLCKPFQSIPEAQLNRKDFTGKIDAMYGPELAVNMDLPPAYDAREDTSFDQDWITPPGVMVGY